MTTIAELFQTKKITTKTRGKAIAQTLNALEPFSDEQAKAISEIDNLMSVKSIRKADEALRRYQAGERAEGYVKNAQSVASRSDKIDGALSARQREDLNDQLSVIKQSAEVQAGGLVTFKYLTLAEKFSTEKFDNPKIQQTVDEAKGLALNALAGKISLFSESNLLENLPEDLEFETEKKPAIGVGL